MDRLQFEILIQTQVMIITLMKQDTQAFIDASKFFNQSLNKYQKQLKKTNKGKG